MYCDCDYDPPTFYKSSVVTHARKHHKCSECCSTIRIGSKYKKHVGVWDGLFYQFIWCENCCDIWQWTMNNIPCLCWEFGNLIDGCKEQVALVWGDDPKENRGLWFGFLRLLVKLKRAQERS